MALGYSRNLYSDMFRTDKYLLLEHGQRLLWIYLWGGPDTLRCGIVKRSYVEQQRQSGLTRSEIDSALALFAGEEYGWIEYDDTYIWVIDFIEDQSNSDYWYTGARKEAQALIGKTELAERCLNHYPAEPPSKRRPNGVPAPSKRRSNGDETASDGKRAQESGSVPESVSEEEVSHSGSNEPECPADGSAGDKKQAGSRKEKPEDEGWVSKADWFARYIEGKVAKHNISHGKLDNRSNAAARELRLLVTTDKIDLKELREALEWAWEERQLPDGLPYGSVLLAVAQWRSKRDGLSKIAKCLHAYRNARRREEPASARQAGPKAVRL